MKIFVETERLILREILPTDLEGMYALDSDPEVHKYLGNQPVTSKDQVADTIQYIRQQYVDYGIGRWAVIDKSTHAFMGWSGLKWVTEPTNNHQYYYDLGYRLIPKFWGKGIATETAIASLAYAFDQLEADSVYAAASGANTGSNRVLRKIGMQFIETFYYEDILCNWYKLERMEYNG